VQHDAPELEKRGPLHLKATNGSWCVDETYIKVKKVWMYLYRAVGSRGEHSGISPQQYSTLTPKKVSDSIPFPKKVKAHFMH
jgi:hypothetical protein